MGHQPENSPANQVYAGPSAGAAIVTPRGDPIPPSRVSDALRLRSPNLKIEWLNAAWGMSAFVIKERWRAGDKRWERVQTGECGEEQAFDVIARFPREISTDEMLGWIENNLGRVRDPRKEADRLVAEAQKLYAQAMETGVDTMVETGTQRILDESDHTRLVRAGAERAHPMVHGADFTPPVERVEPDREPKRLLVPALVPA